MPKVKRTRKPPPDGWELIEPTIDELDAKMREGAFGILWPTVKCEYLTAHITCGIRVRIRFRVRHVVAIDTRGVQYVMRKIPSLFQCFYSFKEEISNRALQSIHRQPQWRLHHLQKPVREVIPLKVWTDGNVTEPDLANKVDARGVQSHSHV